ncbi:HNH endonuclease [Pseudoalteromonas shioyasakiensis]|uniref:HNH endonuclease n=1 Tax=Pseudoalteromonas shioyasakiensis TaxID=1190813 RepID=UPI000785E605|nr:HNH endonuclease [Pseudoalteromonas shioyasakiensis]
MPAAIPKRCREHGCGNKTTLRHGYCEEHAHLASWGKYQKQQQRQGKRVYQTKEYKHTREIVKTKAKCLCINCLTQPKPIVKSGSVCEHIVPVAKGGTEALSNLSWFCESCANFKTGWEKNKTVKAILEKYGHTAINLNS